MTGQNRLFEGLLGTSSPAYPSNNSLLAAALAGNVSVEPLPTGLLAGLLAGTVPSEINTSERLRHLAGKLMNHPDPEVRELAGLGLRHVERYETGK